MTKAKDDDDAAAGDFGFTGKRREVTSPSHHVCFTNVTAILCVMTLVTCLVSVRDIRHRQTLLEEKLGLGSDDGEMACCKCCRGQVVEPQTSPGQGHEGQGHEGQGHEGQGHEGQGHEGQGHEGQSHEGNMETAQGQLLTKTLVYLSKNAPGSALPGHRMSPPADETVPTLQAGRGGNSREGGMEFGRGEGERSPGSQGRSRREVKHSTIENRTTTDTEADSVITGSSGLTSVTPSHLSGSNTLTTLPKEAGAFRSSTQKHPRTEKKVAKRSRSETTKQSKKSERCCERHLTAIHLEAPEDFERKYESGPVISINASDTRDTVYRFWQKASWVEDSASEVFHLDDVTGHVTVEVDGIYLIYAQVVYHDLSGRWSFGIYVGDQERVKCLATEQLRDLNSYHRSSHGVYHSCYTSLVVRVRKNQSVSVRCLYGSRTILTQPQFTFWGIVRL